MRCESLAVQTLDLIVEPCCSEPDDGLGDRSTSFTVADLGFVPAGGGWRKVVGDAAVRFRELRAVAEMEPVVALQQAVWHLPDRDVVPPHELFTVAGTGGAVLGAWHEAGAHFLGFVFGWGGYVNGRPRLRSDMMAVQPGLRYRGLGYALKGLQAAIALERGFLEMVWTVDPLRAANARLNFAKLGATSREYHHDLYGDFGAGLYGAIPTDALVVHWPIASARVRERLLRPRPALTLADYAGLPCLEPGETPVGARVLVELPADVDRLLKTDGSAALSWQARLRGTLPAAFTRGYAITDFVCDWSGDESRAFYVLDRTGTAAW